VLGTPASGTYIIEDEVSLVASSKADLSLESNNDSISLNIPRAGLSKLTARVT
jgi:hypothetical protein